jgi:hypothetical protein
MRRFCSASYAVARGCAQKYTSLIRRPWLQVEDRGESRERVRRALEENSGGSSCSPISQTDDFCVAAES